MESNPQMEGVAEMITKFAIAVACVLALVAVLTIANDSYQRYAAIEEAKMQLLIETEKAKIREEKVKSRGKAIREIGSALKDVKAEFHKDRGEKVAR